MHGEFTELIIHTALFEQLKQQSSICALGDLVSALLFLRKMGVMENLDEFCKPVSLFWAANMEYLLSYEARLLLHRLVLHFLLDADHYHS